MTKEQKIIVIIVYFNSENEIQNCIDSFDNQGVDICLVANSFVPIEIQAYFDKKVKHFCQMNKNVGFAKAVNIGLKITLEQNYDYALLVNPDTLFDNQLLLSSLINSCEAFKNSAIISPLHYNGNKYDHKFEKYYQRKSKTEMENHVEIPFVNAAFWILPKKVIETVGGFDPIFFLYGEDANYVFRLTRIHGIKIIVNNNLIIYHSRNHQINQMQYTKYNIEGYCLHQALKKQGVFSRLFTLFFTFAQQIKSQRKTKQIGWIAINIFFRISYKLPNLVINRNYNKPKIFLS